MPRLMSGGAFAASVLGGAKFSPLSRSPLAWWRLDDGSGAEAVDSSGNGHTGTVAGAAVWEAAAQVGGGLILDGIDDAVGCGSAISVMTSGSVALWVKLASAGLFPMMVTRDAGTGTAWEIGFFEDTRRPYYGQSGVGVLLQGATAVALDTWAHIAVTIDSAAGAVLYLNGVPDASEAGVTSFLNANGTVRIGRRSDGQFLQATVDETVIYGSALAAGQITQLYQWTG